jgi:hypothetical protein
MMLVRCISAEGGKCAPSQVNEPITQGMHGGMQTREKERVEATAGTGGGGTQAHQQQSGTDATHTPTHKKHIREQGRGWWRYVQLFQAP